MEKSEELALEKFLLDIDCLKSLNEWTDNFNLFDTLKITNMEIRHSNILAWLFDPNENHGLGDNFIKSFVNMLVNKCDHSKINTFELLLQDFYSYKVYREANQMDIILDSYEEKTLIIIENKIWSGESNHQLKKYYNKGQTEYNEYKYIIYIFLTPYGTDASDSENWMPFSYEEIVGSIENSIKDAELRDEVRLLLNNYIETVRKNILKEKDEKLIRICNEIYNRHRDALKLIYENVKMDISLESEIICETLKELNDSKEIIYKDNNRWQFFTESMDNYLTPLNEANSSWGTEWVYYYWLEKSGEKLCIHFEIGGWNLTEELKKRTNALIRATNKKVDTYRYKRLFYKSESLSQKNYEESLKKATKRLVKTVLEYEKQLLLSIRNIENSESLSAES